METYEPVACDTKNNNWKLYNTSGESFLNSQPDESINFFITDVPYGITKDSHDTRLSYEQIKVFCSTLRKKLTLDGGFFTFLNFAALNDWNRGLYSAGFRTIRFGSWIKTNGYVKPCPYPTNALEHFVFTTRKSNRGECILPFYLSGQSQKLKSHETSIVSYRKPVSLMRTIILNHTNVGDVVADGFCGSGSTGVAALLDDRTVLLNDIDSLKIDGIINNLKHYQNYSGHKPKEDFLIKERRGKPAQSMDEVIERQAHKTGEKTDRRKTVKTESNAAAKETAKAQEEVATNVAKKSNKKRTNRGFTVEQKAKILEVIVHHNYTERMDWTSYSAKVQESLGRKREVNRTLLARTSKAIARSAAPKGVTLQIPDSSSNNILNQKFLNLTAGKKLLK